LDICHPCYDCNQWERLDEYFTRISAFYDYVLDLVLDEDTSNIPPHPDGGIRETFTGLLPQFLSAARYWDFLLHKSSFNMSAVGQGQSISTAGNYRNVSSNPVGTGSGVTGRMIFEFRKGDCLWEGINASAVEVRLMPRDGKTYMEIDTVDFLDGGLAPTCPEGPAAHTIVVNLTTGADLPSGGELYADVVLMINDTSLQDETGEDFVVKTRFEVDDTHLEPSTQVQETTVYFRPSTSVPSPQQSSGAPDA